MKHEYVVGKWYLVKFSRWHKTLTQIKILGVSPSGKSVKIKYLVGNDDIREWRSVRDVEFVEMLDYE